MRWILLLCACSSSPSGDLYAIATADHIYTTASLSSGTPAAAIALSDTVSLFAVEGTGTAWAVSQTMPIITRYQLAGGTLKSTGTLSFESAGVSASFGTRALVFVSDKKAYLLDDASMQAISFDPSAMTTGRAIDLSMLADASYQTRFAYNLYVRGTQVVVPAYYETSSRSHVTADTSIALIDTASDTATFISDARCGVFSTVAQAQNGDLYFGTDPYSVALHRIGGNGAAPDGCLLRLKAGENLLDQGFFETVTTLTGGPSGGAAIPGPGSLWVRVFDESLFSVTATTSAEAILTAPAWRWWKIDLANPTSAAQSSFAPGSGEVRYFPVGGAAWAAVGSALFDMTASDAPVAGITLSQPPSGIVKLR